MACVLAVLSASFLAPGTACACSCAPYDAAEAAANAAVIVVGTPVESRDGRYGRQYVVQVDRSYKQAVPRRITVGTGTGGGDCGMTMEIGDRRLLVLSGGSIHDDVPASDWYAWLCANLGGDDVLTYAGAPREPLPGAGPQVPGEGADGLSEGALAGIVLGSVGGVVVLTAAGWLLVRRSRRR